MSAFDRMTLRRVRNILLWVETSAMGAYGLSFVSDPGPIIGTASVVLLAVYFTFLVTAR